MISFQNAGLIPLEAITTMGVNAKEGDNPIGYFGTGLKYAIASLLRMGESITIFRGLERISFGLQVSDIRGKSFQIVTMTRGDSPPQALGFTTHMGINWEPWMVFREIYSNMLDEGGIHKTGRLAPREGHTTIMVAGNEFSKAYSQRSQIFLESKPIFEGLSAEIHEGSGEYLYYRGVRVVKLQRKAKFNYNITADLKLTEDRTPAIAYQPLDYIAETLGHCEDRAIVLKAFKLMPLQSVPHFETTDLSVGSYQMTEGFAEIIYAQAKISMLSINEALYNAAQRKLKREIEFDPYIPNSRETQMLSDAQATLESLGYPINHEIKIVQNLGGEVHGLAKDGVIYISRTAFNRGDNWLIGTLFEEELHLSRGLDDCTRPMQNFLIDQLISFGRSALNAGAL